jgi:hypothetical protein
MDMQASDVTSAWPTLSHTIKTGRRVEQIGLDKDLKVNSIKTRTLSLVQQRYYFTRFSKLKKKYYNRIEEN